MTIILDLAALNAATFARLKGEAAGADVRALLGAGAASVIPARALRGALPARPLIAWRQGAVTGQGDDWRRVVGAWWAYDDPAQDYYRINSIVAAIEAAHPLDWLAHYECRVGPIGQGVEDSALGGLLTRSITITMGRRA